MPPRVEITGHKGAGGERVANTVRGFAAAIEAGVDRVEFDVWATGERLVIAHDAGDAAARNPLELDAALAWLAARPVPLSCDVKNWGAEREIGRALARHGVAERTIVCGHNLPAIREVGRHAGRVRIGWSVPEPPGTPNARVDGPVEAALAAGWRARLPALVAGLARDGELDGVMCHRALVTGELVDAVHAAGGFVSAWVVDRADEARRLAALGVDGMTTNFPRRIARALARGEPRARG